MTIFDRFFYCAGASPSTALRAKGLFGMPVERCKSEIRSTKFPSSEVKLLWRAGETNSKYKLPKSKTERWLFLRFCFDVVLYPRFYGDKFTPAKAEVVRVSRGKSGFVQVSCAVVLNWIGQNSSAKLTSEDMKKAKLLPPVYFVIYLSLAIGFHFVLPAMKVIYAPYNYVGILLIGIGVWLNIRADKLFKKRNTTVKPFEKSTYFIEEGPFAFSRHPMYLGMVVILTGVAVILGSVTPFIAAIACFITMDIAFIRHEEKALEETFGQKFLDYKKRVRRWL